MEGDELGAAVGGEKNYFNPLPPHGGRRSGRILSHRPLHFNPLPPHGGRQQDDQNCKRGIQISIHSLRMEGDPRGRFRRTGIVIFQSTPSAWRETFFKARRINFGVISIHSLRMEGDRTHTSLTRSRCHFNPLPPHGGRRICKRRQFPGSVFQSTPSAWRETVQKECTPPPICISIHSLRMEGDPTDKIADLEQKLFQSTPSAWRETGSSTVARQVHSISIHSLRMEGDRIRKNWTAWI